MKAAQWCIRNHGVYNMPGLYPKYNDYKHKRLINNNIERNPPEFPGHKHYFFVFFLTPHCLWRHTHTHRYEKCKQRTHSEKPPREYLVPRLPWKQISVAHHWKCWKVGLSEGETDRREGGGERERERELWLKERPRHKQRQQEKHQRHGWSSFVGEIR